MHDELAEFCAGECVPDDIVKDLNLSTQRQWKLSGKRSPNCRPFPSHGSHQSPWEIVDTTGAALKNWNGTFSYAGSLLYEGRILTSEYDAIDKILNEIRANHTEYALSPTSGVCRLGRAEPKHADYVRLVCACARECGTSTSTTPWELPRLLCTYSIKPHLRPLP